MGVGGANLPKPSRTKFRCSSGYKKQASPRQGPFHRVVGSIPMLASMNELFSSKPKVMFIPNQLKGVFSLSINIKLFIPSTTEVDKEGSVMQAIYERKALTLFSELFGGATSYGAMGAWSSASAGLVTEKIQIVESFASTDAIATGFDAVARLAGEMKLAMGQEAIALQYQNEMFFL